MTFQDQVILVAQETHQSIDTVLGLDLLSFESLHLSCLRLRAQRTRDGAWVAMMAAQGTEKGMKALEANWKKVSEIDLLPEGANDAAEFLRKFGKGI